MRIIKAKEVADKLSISVAYVHILSNKGKLPKPIRVSEGRLGWIESEVEDWMRELVQSQRS